MPLPLSQPLPPYLPPTSCLLIDYWLYREGRDCVPVCVWWVVCMKTELMGSTSNALTVEELVGQWVHFDLSSSRDDQSKCWCRLIYNPERTQTLPLADIMHMSKGNEQLLRSRGWGLGATAEVRVGALKAKFGLCVELNWNHHHTPPSYHIFCPVGDVLEPVRCNDGPITWMSIGFTALVLWLLQILFLKSPCIFIFEVAAHS